MKTSAALVKLIVFMVVTSFLTFTLAATIGNLSFGGKVRYAATFSDVTGLLPGNDVRIAGVRVGSVDGIDLQGRNLAKVSFSLENGRTIPQSTIVALRYRNLVGERYLALTEGPGSATPLKQGSTIPLAQTRNALDLTVLFNGFRPLFQALDPQTTNQMAFEIVQTLQGEGGTVQNLVAKTASLTQTLADRDQVIGRVIDNLNTVLATVDANGNGLSNLILQLRQLATGFAQDRQAIGQSIAGIGDLTSATTQLLTDIRPGLRDDITQLGALSKNLNDSSAVVDGVLQRLPTKLDRIIGTAGYGSWFDFYLCGAQGLVTMGNNPDGTPKPFPVPGVTSTSGAFQLVNPASRCRFGG